MTPYRCHRSEVAGVTRRQAYAMTFHVMAMRTKGPRWPSLSLSSHQLNGPWLGTITELLGLPKIRQYQNPEHATVHRHRCQSIRSHCAETERLDHAWSVLCQPLEPRHSNQGDEKVLDDPWLSHGIPDIARSNLDMASIFAWIIEEDALDSDMRLARSEVTPATSADERSSVTGLGRHQEDEDNSNTERNNSFN